MNSVRHHIPSLSISITISEDLAPNGGKQINVSDSNASHQVRQVNKYKWERKSEFFHVRYKVLFKLILRGKRVSEKDSRFFYRFIYLYSLAKLGTVLLKH